MRSFKLIPLTACILVLFACSRQPEQVVMPSPTEVQEAIEREVAELRNQMPRVIEPGITCRDVKAGPRTVIYDIEVAESRFAKNKDKETQLEEIAFSRLSKNDSLRRVLGVNVRLHYKFFDASKQFLCDFTVHGS